MTAFYNKKKTPYILHTDNGAIVWESVRNQLSIIKPICIVQNPTINMCVLLCPIKQESTNKRTEKPFSQVHKTFSFSSMP